MLGRGAANIAESSEKLEEIERQLKLRLSKAKEVASSCKIDTSNAQSHEELMAELEVNSSLLRDSRSLPSTPTSTTITPTGRPTSKTSSTSR